MMDRLKVRAAAAAAVLVATAGGLTLQPQRTHAAVGNAPPAGTRRFVSDAALALRWAPIHYQDVDTTGAHAAGGRADYVTRVDFDGDWAGRDNWEDAPDHPLAAVVYYSVVETSTHWYLTYMFFHTRDWIDHPFFETEHENDSEGVLFAVERDGSAYGTLRAAVTVAHSDFYSYTPAGSTWTSGRESIDGTLRLQSSPHDGFRHPVTAQEAHGHGLKALPYLGIEGDGLVYYPSTVADEPRGPDDRDVRYRLVDIFAPGGLWDQRDNRQLFAAFGSFAGDASGSCGHGTIECTTDKANPPWGWDDEDDSPGRGDLATDPARVAADYFTVPGELSHTYTRNPYPGGLG